MKKEDYEKIGLNAEAFKYLSNIYERLSGFRQAECNWSKLAQQIASFQNTGINYNVLQERLNSEKFCFPTLTPTPITTY